MMRICDFCETILYERRIFACDFLVFKAEYSTKRLYCCRDCFLRCADGYLIAAIEERKKVSNFSYITGRGCILCCQTEFDAEGPSDPYGIIRIGLLENNRSLFTDICEVCVTKHVPLIDGYRS